LPALDQMACMPLRDHSLQNSLARDPAEHRGVCLGTRIGFRHPEKEASFTSLKEGCRFHPAESGFSP